MLRLLVIPHKKNGYEPYLLKKAALVIYTVILLLVNVFPGAIPFLSADLEKVSASSISAEKLIELTNKDRVTYGLNQLQGNVQLTAAAFAKASNMISKQYWDHFGPNGETPWQFIQGAGYVYVFAGENLAKGFKTSEGVHQAWMASKTHRENILSGNYKEIGIAVVQGKLLGEETTLVVQMFGNRTNEVQNIEIGEVNSSNTSNENGDIKSIKITNPHNGTLTNSRNLNIEGTATNIEGYYNIEISDLKATTTQALGVATSSGDNWSFSLGHDWKEGVHEIKASLESDRSISDSVTFTLDSTAPVVNEASINGVLTQAKDNGDRSTITISASADDPNASLMLIVDSKSYAMTANSIGLFSTTLGVPDSVKTVSLIASDHIGNMIEIDITQKFCVFAGIERDSENEFAGFISSIGLRDLISFGIAGLVLILLIVEILYYRRIGRLAEKGNALMLVGIWVSMIVFGIVSGFVGKIG